MGSLSEEKPYIEAHVPYIHSPPPTYIAGALQQYRRVYDKPLRKVWDVRAYPEFNINNTGFQLISIPEYAEDGFDDKSWVEQHIYPTVQNVVCRATGATRVHPFSHLVRRKDISAIQKLVDDKSIDDEHIPSNVGAVPSPAAHIDHSADGSWEVLRDNLPDVAKDYGSEGKGGRWGIINLWRPLRRVRRDPLVVCDSRSVEWEDLVIQVCHSPFYSWLPTVAAPSRVLTSNVLTSCVQRVFLKQSSAFASVSAGDSFETVGVKYNPNHKWYFVSDMTPDEALLIKIHDSSAGEEGKHGLTSGGIPHTALQIPGTEGMEARESIEVRCLVFWD
jgi:hypothetical protein